MLYYHQSGKRPRILGSRLLCGLFASLLIASTPVVLQAQVTGEAILENVVDDYGPKYSDVDSAVESIRAGRGADALESLKKAKEKNPNLAPADTMLAEILFRSNQAPQAQQSLQEAVKNAPNDPGAYVYLGELSLQSGRLAEAKLLLDKAVELLEPYNENQKRKNRMIVGAYGGLTTLSEVQEDWPRAKELLEVSLQADPDNSLTQTRLGRVLFKMSESRDDERQVYNIFKELHSKDEKTAHPDVNMALLYQQAGKPDNAKQMMTRAAEKDANNIRTRLAVAKWALGNSEFDLAKTNAEAALGMDANSLEAKLYIGLVNRFQNDLVAAEEMLKDAHLQSPTHLGANTQLALVLIDQSDERKRAQALTYARMLAQLYPDLKENSGRESAVTLAWVLYKMGQQTSAERAIQQTINTGGTRLSADSSFHAAQILYDGGLTDASRRLLEQAVANETAFPSRKAAEQLLLRIKNR